MLSSPQLLISSIASVLADIYIASLKRVRYDLFYEPLQDESGDSDGSRCYRPHVDEDALQDHACTLFYKVCMDQVNLHPFSR